jgi:hypothetical protein
MISDSAYDRLHQYITKENGNPYKFDLLRACAGRRSTAEEDEDTSEISP